jgi:hypothetical protein
MNKKIRQIAKLLIIILKGSNSTNTSSILALRSGQVAITKSGSANAISDLAKTSGGAALTLNIVATASSSFATRSGKAFNASG